LIASGAQAKTEKRAVVHQLSTALKMDPTPFETLLDVREDKSEAKLGDPGELFAAYLQSIQRMIEFVDKLEGA
ncbi:MAG TPA: hypothetical protein VKS01_04555, partial [Bryobacteraceae bacterium]|nr:hypothetical protein [Bryobacteraceae bacterium]